MTAAVQPVARPLDFDPVPATLDLLDRITAAAQVLEVSGVGTAVAAARSRIVAPMVTVSVAGSAPGVVRALVQALVTHELPIDRNAPSLITRPLPGSGPRPAAAVRFEFDTPFLATGYSVLALPDPALLDLAGINTVAAAGLVSDRLLLAVPAGRVLNRPQLRSVALLVEAGVPLTVVVVGSGRAATDTSTATTRALGVGAAVGILDPAAASRPFTRPDDWRRSGHPELLGHLHRTARRPAQLAAAGGAARRSVGWIDTLSARAFVTGLGHHGPEVRRRLGDAGHLLTDLAADRAPWRPRVAHEFSLLGSAMAGSLTRDLRSDSQRRTLRRKAAAVPTATLAWTAASIIRALTLGGSMIRRQVATELLQVGNTLGAIPLTPALAAVTADSGPPPLPCGQAFAHLGSPVPILAWLELMATLDPGWTTGATVDVATAAKTVLDRISAMVGLAAAGVSHEIADGLGAFAAVLRPPEQPTGAGSALDLAGLGRLAAAAAGSLSTAAVIGVTS